jgi:hypothetical protein
MDKLIDVVWRKYDKEQKKLTRMLKKNERPSVAIKTEMMELRKKVREYEGELNEYRSIKENKIPYWDKLKDHCSHTPYYKFSVQSMLAKGMKSEA